MTDWERCLKLNVLAPMALTHAFSPGMVKRKVKVITSLTVMHCACHSDNGRRQHNTDCGLAVTMQHCHLHDDIFHLA